ncbi:MAG: gamma-glutamyltransferase [Pirellulales bacterium]
MNSTTRREFLASCAGGLVLSATQLHRPARASFYSTTSGIVCGEPSMEPIGQQVLADGGNAVDALVATALAAAVTQMQQTGIGGYGAHAVFASGDGKTLAAIDANSTAPASFTNEIFKPDSNGKVPNDKHMHGWLSSGVPGVLAGLAQAAKQYGSWSLHDLLQPAIRLARDGFELSPPTANAIASSATKLQLYSGSRSLYIPDGRVPRAGERFSNPELAAVLETVAKANSDDPFYRGDVAGIIADRFAREGGMVTRADFANYQARLVKPLSLTFGDIQIITAPLTAGGFTVLQTLELLQALNWPGLQEPVRTHAQIEAVRLCWRDRLNHLGDFSFGKKFADSTSKAGELINLESEVEKRLRSQEYLQQSAAKVRQAIINKQLLEPAFRSDTQAGTLNFSVVDKHGNMMALTLTHGEAFGSKVTVDGLGLTLGHGMSRFDVQPRHPNAPGPGKRPLNNMCPTIVLKAGRPVCAVGGRGGRKIPNAVLEFLIQLVLNNQTAEAAMRAPRFHTEGGKQVEYQKGVQSLQANYLTDLGYATKEGTSATLSAVAMEPDGSLIRLMR